MGRRENEGAFSARDVIPRVSAGTADDYQPGDYPLQCAHCDEVLTDKANFQTHMRGEHPA